MTDCDCPKTRPMCFLKDCPRAAKALQYDRLVQATRRKLLGLETTKPEEGEPEQ